MYRIMEHSSRAIVGNSNSTHELTTTAKASSSMNMLLPPILPNFLPFWSQNVLEQSLKEIHSFASSFNPRGVTH